MRAVIAGIMALAAALTTRAVTNDAEALFSTANQSYEQGKYAEAKARYESMVTNGYATAAAWFNLGNARFKTGELGPAIAAWRQAERLTPRDAALRANLQFGRKKAAGDSDPRISWRAVIVRAFTLNEWTAAAAIATALFFALLAIREATPRRAWGGALTASAVSAVLLLVLTGCSYADFMATHAVVVKATSARFAPLDDSQTAFQLSDGAELDVVDGTAAWIEGRTTEGKLGWVKRDSVVIIK